MLGMERENSFKPQKERITTLTSTQLALKKIKEDRQHRSYNDFKTKFYSKQALFRLFLKIIHYKLMESIEFFSNEINYML